MFDEERRSAGVIECGFNSKIIPFFKSRGENVVRETGEWNVIGPEANRLGFPMIWSELLKSASFQKTMRRSTPERRGYTIDCWWKKKKDQQKERNLEMKKALFYCQVVLLPPSELWFESDIMFSKMSSWLKHDTSGTIFFRAKHFKVVRNQLLLY